jgi:HD-like signal output (HDOD) protein
MSKSIDREALRRIENLPTLPAVLTQVLQTVSDPDSSALDLGQKILADQSIASTILRLVNSAYYGFQRRISNIHEAIALLGFSTVADLVLAASVFRQFNGQSGAFDRPRLWRHALAVGMASDRLAKTLRISQNGGLYSAGLLHDIGKVALDWLYPEIYAETANKAVEDGISAFDAEREAFGTDHCEVGSILAARWNLPATVVEAIRLHHTPDQSVEFPKVAYLIADLGAPGNGAPPEPPAAANAPFVPTQAQQDEVVNELSTASELIGTLLGTLQAA